MQHANDKLGDLMGTVLPPPRLTLVKTHETIEDPYCPTCKSEYSETAHGWIREYSDHVDHTGHHRKWGYCEIPCPLCSTGAIERRKARKQAENVAHLFGDSNIPHHARKWTFTSLPGDADKKAIATVKEFVSLHLEHPDSEGKRGLWLGGGPGRCKTGLAVSVLQEVIQQGESALFIMTIELMNKLRASFGKASDFTEDDVLSTVSSIKWLVLDDIATERPTPYVLEQFYYIIEKRRSQGLYTIFTSNLSTKDLEKLWRPEQVEEGAFHAGVRVLERIRESCEGIAVKGRNQRERDW